MATITYSPLVTQSQIRQESDRFGRQIIRKQYRSGIDCSINRDDGSYQLIHGWDRLLTDIRNRKSVLMKTSGRRSKRRQSTFQLVVLQNILRIFVINLMKLFTESHTALAMASLRGFSQSDGSIRTRPQTFNLKRQQLSYQKYFIFS